MKKRRNKIFLIPILAMVFMGINSCDVENVTDIYVQYPMFFYFNFEEETAPGSSVDYTDLNDYEEYRDNKDNLEKAEILHFNYWIEDISYPTDEFDFENLIFDFVRFEIEFLAFGEIPVPGEKYLLNEYTNVKVADYYRTAQHIHTLGDDIIETLSIALQKYPRFRIISTYSKVQGVDEFYFDYIRGRVDATIRLTSKL